MQDKIEAIVELGLYMGDIAQGVHHKSKKEIYQKYKESTHQIICQVEKKNAWFTEKNIHYCLNSWAKALSKDNIEYWLSQYNIKANHHTKNIGVIMAGNIPMVGFHDLLCVLFSSHHFYGKLSADDSLLIPHWIEILSDINFKIKEQIHFTSGFMKGMDAYIGTGSNNTSRYFEYYFRNYPHIIRANRNSVAILTGNETNNDLENLGQDIFRYFGLGCRNVSKLFVPKHYNFNAFFEAMYPYHEIVSHHKYNNNYEYNRTVYLMGNEKLLDNNFLLLKEDKNYSSPIAVLFYEYYNDMQQLQEKLSNEKSVIQCLIAAPGIHHEALNFGNSQMPQLWDYADGVDTMNFLLNL